MIRITQHRAHCIGCGYCEEIAPYRWKMDAWDGKASLINARGKNDFFNVLTTDDEYEDNIEAANHCPVKIIKVEKV